MNKCMVVYLSNFEIILDNLIISGLVPTIVITLNLFIFIDVVDLIITYKLIINY